MAAEKTNSGQSLMDTLISELMNAGADTSALDLCLTGDVRGIRAVPLRYRLIALGFVKGLSPEEVNRRLLENGCAQLYARSIREATLLYAFRDGLSYEEWKSLEMECRSLREELSHEQGVLSSPSLTLAQIRAYVLDNSLSDHEIARTQHRTQMLEQELSRLPADHVRLRSFLLSNIRSFSTVREKTRYYFCKYLSYFLDTRLQRYVHALRTGAGLSSALEGLNVFRVRTALDRKKHTPEAAEERILNAPLSLGGIYDAFQYFYFEYISIDWLQIRLETYAGPEDISPEERRSLSGAIRRRNPALRALSDSEVLRRTFEAMEQAEDAADRKYSLTGETGSRQAVSYQSGRSGENYLRHVLRGELDPDRTTFLAFLLFFGRVSAVPAPHQIDARRLDEILTECGFPPLRGEDRVDSFFLRFLKAEDPMMFLLEEAEELAMSEENFYLYKTWLSSSSNERGWDEITEN